MAYPYDISILSRWRSHREIERRFGMLARLQVKGISDFAFNYYAVYVSVGIEHDEALRLAPLSEQMGDDITNYPELAYPEGRD